VVARGDDLWSLAELYYGEGREWRKIARANPRVLTGGPDRLEVGWRLVVPGVTTVAEKTEPKKGDRRATSDVGRGTVDVRSGDTLSSIADDAYGTPSRWRQIFEANRAVISDPDEIAIGARLILPPAGADGPPASARPKRDTREPSPKPDESAERKGSVRRPAPVEDPPQSSSSALPTSAQPSGSGPSVTSAPPSARGPHSPARERVEEVESSAGVADAAPTLLGVGGLLTAALLTGLFIRRRAQLQVRPVGRRILQPDAAAQRVETAMGRLQQPVTLATLDLATRALAAHAVEASTALPPLVLAKVDASAVELVMTEPTEDPPLGFVQRGRSWSLEQQETGYLATLPGIDAAARPFPALVSLGVDEEARQVLVDLETLGLLALTSDQPALADGMLAAMIVELSFAPWADDMTLTVVGDADGLPEALGKHNVTATNQVDAVLDRLELRAAAQRAQGEQVDVRRLRLDPDLAEPWAPEIVLVNAPLTSAQGGRLLAVTTTSPRTTIAAVVAGSVVGAPWTLELASGGPAAVDESATPVVSARLQPYDLLLTPQLLTPTVRQAVVELVTATGTDSTTPAPWWDHADDPPKGTPPDDITDVGRRFGGWGSDNSGQAKGSEMATQEQQGGGSTGVHPVLRLLGPVELVGASGTLPPRAGKQCLEYCGWLLENPATTAQAMAAALVVAEGTRRSNMSRLRTWLGADTEGAAYLPDAYTGRIVLHSAVSSDWQRLQILTAAGVNTTSTSGLRAALELVRGAPLADAAPGQWHWAEELRTDMISTIRDIGVELSFRAINDHDIDLARWAASRALVAAPGDELLMAARIRTEHQAGNVAETERLTLALAAQARSLGVDLDAGTVVLLQEVMEGRVRAQAVGAPS
jgi:LysM repeat protein